MLLPHVVSSEVIAACNDRSQSPISYLQVRISGFRDTELVAPSATRRRCRLVLRQMWGRQPYPPPLLRRFRVRSSGTEVDKSGVAVRGLGQLRTSAVRTLDASSLSAWEVAAVTAVAGDGEATVVA